MTEHTMTQSGIEAMEAMFARASAEGRAAFLPYYPIGYPNYAASLDAVTAMSEVGVDGFEIGIPFSDPLADGPVIQAATQIALENGMTVRTDTEAVRDLQKTALKLLFSVHRVDCKNCPANKACALQGVAKFLKAGLTCKPFERVLKEPEVDSRHPVFDYYPNRCVLCGICVRVCGRRNGQSQLSFAGRGFDTVVGYFGSDAASAEDCRNCKACLEACPTGALVEKT